ncbi:MAG: sulfate permease [Chloroflexi bacterium]|nr:sulfate permease [Chloroflexota bacterium]
MALAPALPVSRRFAWGWGEVSGALGDLGTFLPHILGVIAVVGMSPVGVLSTFGALYMASGLVYGIPIPVQPMKAASAVVLVQRLSPAEIAAAGLVLGLAFTLLAVSGLASRLARLTPSLVVSGIQLGVGVSLALLGARFMGEQVWLTLLVLAAMAIMFLRTRLPTALVAVVLGSLLAYVAAPDRHFPELTLGLHWPDVVLPTWRDVVRATELAVLPQIPLTLTNALIVTSALSRQLFPERGDPAPVSKLSLTTGLGNLMAAPLGGYMMCHGSGGLAGHYRFGARTATAPVLIGVSFLALGLLLGESATPLLRLVPAGVVGALLFFSGLELASASGLGRLGWRPAAFVLALGVVGIAYNPAVAFAVGLVLWYGYRSLRRVTKNA